jgi:NAD(P)-dependent dehydrogenase (short-subunit alcohol dehydrogenase family)
MATEKIALITGANKGIGLEMARQLGAQKVTVLLGTRDLNKGQTVAKELVTEGLDIRAVKLDVVSAEDIRALAALIEQDYGHLDILINNAGIMIEPGGFASNTTLTSGPDLLHETFETNFFAVVALTLHATPGAPIYNSKTFAYDASKAALNSFTIHLAHALKDTKIKVNSAHPGWVKTDMGGESAPMELTEGAKTGVALATLPDGGPTGGYFHMGEKLPW